MLATRMEHCYYGVLGDFPDGKQAQRPGEGELLRLAKSLVEELNQKYPRPTPLFYYLHRRRTYQKADGLYMGWERKRGALCQLVTLLTQGDATPFVLLTHPLPQGIRLLPDLGCGYGAASRGPGQAGGSHGPSSPCAGMGRPRGGAKGLWHPGPPDGRPASGGGKKRLCLGGLGGQRAG